MKHKKGLWSPDEDQRLRDYVMNYGHGCWSVVPINAGLQRNGKSCRLRWINYLRPGLKKGSFSMQEEETIHTLHDVLGNKWSLISQHLPGRTDNEIKNHWHSYLKKQVAKPEYFDTRVKLECTNSNTGHTGSSSTSSSTTSPAATSTVLASHMNSITRKPSLNPLNIAKVNELPKILFADWLSLEEFQGHDSLNYQIAPMNGLVSNEGSSDSSETINCLNNYSNEDMFHSHMKNEQIFNFNCGDFNIEDFLYM